MKKKRRLSKNELSPINENVAIKKCGTAMYFTNKTKIKEKNSAMIDAIKQIFLL